MTIALVTGASGFVAGHLAQHLRECGIGTLIGVDVRQDSGHGFDTFEVADLAEAGQASRLIRKGRPDLVFHLAGTVAGDDSAIWRSNAETTRQLLGAVANGALTARVVVVGSAAEYGRVPSEQQPVSEDYRGTPVNAYGRAKAEVSRLAFQAAQEYGAEVVVARPFNIVGPGIPDLLVVGAIIRRLRSALATPPPYRIRLGRTDSVRDFVAVEDVVAGFVSAVERGRRGEAYNLCSGTGRTVQWLVDQLVTTAEADVEVIRDQTLIRADEIDVIVGCVEKARSELDWIARRPLEQSLRDTWRRTVAEANAG